jgi:hypothetical protein
VRPREVRYGRVAMSASLTLPTPIRVLARSADGAQLVAVHETAFTRVDVASLAATGSGPVSGVVYACGITPDGASVLLGARSPCLVDLASGKVAGAAFKGPTSAANALAFSADGTTVYLAHGSFAAPADCFVYAFDLVSRALRWRAAATPGDGATDVVCVADRVVVFGEQGVVALLEPARGASAGRVQLVAPAPYGGALVLGAALDATSVVAATLDEGEPLVARVTLGEGKLPVAWRSTLALDEADPDEAVVMGRPFVTGASVHVPVRWSDGEAAHLTLVTLDADTGAVRGERELDGCHDHRGVIALPGDRVAWAAGATLRVEALV